MSLIPSFVASQILGLPNEIVLTDNSTGSDGLIKSRVAYFQKSDGTYLTDNAGSSPAIVVAEVKAVSYIGGVGVGTAGDIYAINVDDPTLGTVLIATYTLIGTETLTILVTALINAINNSTSGYTANNYSPTTLNVVAKAGLGATINTHLLTISWGSNSTFHSFENGVTEVTLPLASQNYMYWPYADSSITYNLLTKDMALTVKVDWLGATNDILYTKTLLYVFPRFNIEFDYSLSYSEANGLASINSTNWLTNRMKLRVAINDAINAISEASSITDSQAACERGTELRLNQNSFY